MESFAIFLLIVTFLQGFELIIYLTPSLPSKELIFLLSLTLPAVGYFIMALAFGEVQLFSVISSSIWHLGCSWVGTSLLTFLYLQWRAKGSFPPLIIPWRRRGQALATMIFWPMPLWGLVAQICLLTNRWTRWPCIVWTSYMVFFDKTPSQGGWKKCLWWTDQLMFHLCCEFFPSQLIKTAELDPAKSYIVGYHPHGILGIGAWCNFCTEGTGIGKLFPGITFRLLTLKELFWIPLFRQFLLMCGACNVSKASINWLLSRPGNAAVVIVGGAVEALDAAPGTLDLTLTKRKGFVKQALINGASLVPVLCFGENDIFETVGSENSKLLKAIQKKLKNVFHYALPIFHGRGMLNYMFGLLPFRRPMNTVVGNPIDVPSKIAEPTKEQIEEYHQKYVKELQKIYDTYKDKFAPNRKRDLVIK